VNDGVRAACSCKWAVRGKECVVVPRSSDDENVALIDELIPVNESDEERVKVVKRGRTMEGGENRGGTRHIPRTSLSLVPITLPPFPCMPLLLTERRRKVFPTYFLEEQRRSSFEGGSERFLTRFSTSVDAATAVMMRGGRGVGVGVGVGIGVCKTGCGTRRKAHGAHGVGKV
jgi:hypothetical protein